MIYFMQSLDGGAVKIGFTDDLDTRRKALESHYGQPLALLGTLPGGRDEEQAIHARFAHLRFGRTEQFRPDSELMAFIGRPLFVNQGDVELMELSPGVRKVVFQIKGSEEWKEWLDGLARQLRMPTSAVVDNALVMYAKAQGYDPNPPER